MPRPQAFENDVVVRVHCAGFTRGELTWPATWVDRAGRDRTPSVPGHELAGVVAELGYGTTGLSIGQRVFGLADWSRDGALAEFVAVEARNLAPLPIDVDYAVGAALAISGLTASQALFRHGRLRAGQTVLVHGAAGNVGSLAVQLARLAGARVIGTGRTNQMQTAYEVGVDRFVDLEREQLEEAGPVDLVLDVLGGEVRDRSTALVRPGGTLVTIDSPPSIQPVDGRAVFFVVEPDRNGLIELARRVRNGEVRPLISSIRSLGEAPAALAASQPASGRTIVKVA